MDVLVVGCGLSGAVIARYFADKGKKVCIYEKRNHIGGNMYDYVDNNGFLVQKYGPHTFHTKEKNLYEFMCKYEKWETYKLTCGAMWNGKYTPTPFNFTTIDTFYTKDKAKLLKEKIKKIYGRNTLATVLDVLQSDDDDVRGYAEYLFENDYAPYTAKQWGVSPNDIDPSVLKRVPLRFSYDEGYFDDEYQVMPETSFTEFFKNILNHPNIGVLLNVNALDLINIKNNKITFNNEAIDIPVIYTGPIDELFGGVYGKLPYRSLRFEWYYEDIESLQNAPVVAYPQEKGFTRITEYKKLPVQNKKGTVYAKEYPIKYEIENNAEPYYPILTKESNEQYLKYLKLSKNIKNLYLCGRLADFKYYNMDQTLKRALELCDYFEINNI